MQPEARDAARFVWSTLRHGDKIDRIAELAGVLSTLASAFLYAWETAFAFGALTLSFVLGRRAYSLQKEIEPSIACVGLGVLSRGREHYVRASVKNLSLGAITGLRASLEEITSSSRAFALGQIRDKIGNYHQISYPVQLFTAEQLKERLGWGQKFARSFNLAAGEATWLEIFQVSRRRDSWEAYLYDSSERHNLITPDDMTFHCAVRGPGPPVEFNMAFKEEGKGSYRLTLTDKDGVTLEEKSFHEAASE
jgi:hypothetical protein